MPRTITSTSPSARIVALTLLSSRIGKALALICCTFFLASCLDEKELIRKFAPPEDNEFARRFIDLVREGRYEQVDPMLDPAAAKNAGANGLAQLHRIVDHGEPLAIELIGANVGYFKPWNGSAPSRQANLVYQIQFRDAWVVATVVVQSNNTGRHIISVFFQPVPDSLQVLNRFTLRNNSIVHYLFFAGVIIVPLFILIALIVCIRSRVRHRWLWILFILFGFVQWQLNWTTGEWSFQPFSVNLFGAAGMRASSYAPLVLGVSIPVGAILFLLLRRRLRRKDEPPLEATAPPQAAL